MVINHNINTTILTDNNLEILSLLNGEDIISSLDDLKKIKSSFVVFNDVLRDLKEKDFLKLMNLLERNNIHFINITSNIEEALYAQKLMVYVGGKVEIEGATVSVLKEEKILKRLGFSLPFVVDLSLQLNYYNLIDAVFLDERLLVDKLW